MNSYHTDNCQCGLCKDAQEFGIGQGTYNDIVKKLQEIRLLVVGNKKYPSGAMGIAFCKSTWRDILATNCSGRYLLCALGVNLQKAQRTFCLPEDLFKYLAKLGIVFWNYSEIDTLIQFGVSIEETILCGPNAEKILRNANFVNKINKFPYYIPKHPSPEGVKKNNQNDIWFRFWGTYGKIPTELNSIYNGCNIGLIIQDANARM